MIHKNFKTGVRARMERTGESYQVARDAVLLGREEPVQADDKPRYGSRMTDEEVFREYGEHLGVPIPKPET